MIAPEAQADVLLSIDGEPGIKLQTGDRVVVTASHYLSRFIRLRERNYFYRSILDRMEPRMPERPRSADSHASHRPQPVAPAAQDNHDGSQQPEQPAMRNS